MINKFYFVMPINLFNDCNAELKNKDANKLALYLKNKSYNPFNPITISLAKIREEFKEITFEDIEHVIEKIWIYGSLIDGTFNSQSDIDVWIICNNRASKRDKREIKDLIKKFFKEKFNLQSDIFFGDNEDMKRIIKSEKELLWHKKQQSA